MCIIGCSPKRAGLEYFNNLKITEHLKVFEFQINLSKSEKDLKKIFDKIRSTKTPKNYVYQGDLITGDLITYDPENIKRKKIFRKKIFLYIRNSLGLERRIIFKHIKHQATINILVAYSKKDNIKSFLYGDSKFTMPHWFISKQPREFNTKYIDDEINIFEISTLDEAKKIIKKRRKKTPCVFCSVSLYNKIKKEQFKIPEIMWCTI